MSHNPAPEPIRIAINGFGRIGRASLRIIFERLSSNSLDFPVEIIAINDLTPAEMLAHLLRYDTAYGKFSRPVDVVPATPTEPAYLVVADKRIPVFSEKDPLNLPWKDLHVDVVLECTGHFVRDGKARVHLEAGARKVVLSAPAKGGDVPTYLMGVNHMNYVGEPLISNASCTTNCIAPVVQLLSDAFGVEKSLMTTIHAVTSTQNLVDGPNKDMRRARAAYRNLIPTSTGAAIATSKVVPQLEGIFDGVSVRVPVLTGSLSDITLLLSNDVTVDEINSVLRSASESPRYAGILGVTTEPLVSSDIVQSSYSSLVDLSLTKVVGGNLAKVFSWYDNEWGYTNRLVDLALYIASHENKETPPEGGAFTIV